jgi:hypothetical protein
VSRRMDLQSEKERLELELQEVKKADDAYIQQLHEQIREPSLLLLCPDDQLHQCPCMCSSRPSMSMQSRGCWEQASCRTRRGGRAPGQTSAARR